LLRIEVRGWILMREMDAVVAGGVVPAAVDVDCTVAGGEREMTVGLIDETTGALSFEVEDDVG
jgi:hypothetical protein